MDMKRLQSWVTCSIASTVLVTFIGLVPWASAQDVPVAGGPADAPPATDMDMSDKMAGGAEDALIPLSDASQTGIEEIADRNLINVTVENETLENVVNMFARISGANIVTTSADLEGTVTVNLRGVEWRPALSSILAVHNLALKEQLPGSQVYTIVPRPPDAAEPLVVKSVFLHFTTVPELSPIVQTMMGSVSNATLSAFASRNALVIKTTEANMREIEKLIVEMDVPGRQVVVETKFMELSDGASKKLGIRWDSLDEYAINVVPGYDYGRLVDRTATRENANNYNRDIATTRTETRQYDINGQPFEDVGSIEYVEAPDGTFKELTKKEPTSSFNQLDSEVQSTVRNIGDTYAKTITEATTAVLDLDAFSAVLSALKTTEGVSVISNPKIIVASGSKDAYFTVGEREPIIKVDVQRGTQESPGDTITSQLDTSINTDYIKEGYLETGIHLQVVPVVKTEELIEALIQPKLVRRLLPDKVVGENSWPRISVKEIKTTFTLRSGQTVAIGGLTDTSDDKKTSKVPLLGDIPLIGKYLFSHTADVKNQVETIIFVTLSLAEAEGLYREAGIPEGAQLVHKKLITSEAERARLESELEDLRQAQDEAEAERVRTRLLKRRQ